MLSQLILPQFYGSILLHGLARSGVHFAGLQIAAEFAANEGRAIMLLDNEADRHNIADRLAAIAKHQNSNHLDVRYVVDPRTNRSRDYALTLKPLWPFGVRPVLIVRDVSRSMTAFDAASDPFLRLVARDLVRSGGAYVLTVAASNGAVPVHCADAIHELKPPTDGSENVSRLTLIQHKPTGRTPITLAAKTLPTTVVFEMVEEQPSITSPLEAAHA